METLKQESLWDVHRAAAYLSASPATVYAWVEAGRIPYLKLGRLVRFDPERLMAWVEAQQREAAS